MKKDGVYYCMHKRDVMCAHAKERLTAIMKRLWLKFHKFYSKERFKTLSSHSSRMVKIQISVNWQYLAK